MGSDRKLGYRVRSLGNLIEIEFDRHSRVRLTVDQLVQITPRLADKSTRYRKLRRHPKRGGLQKSKRQRFQERKEIVTSAALRAGSIEAQGRTPIRVRKRQGGLPGLGKNR